MEYFALEARTRYESKRLQPVEAKYCIKRGSMTGSS
jgi:hypothetical protein